MKAIKIFLVFFLFVESYEKHINAKTHEYKFHSKLLVHENAPLAPHAKVQGHPLILAQASKDLLASNNYSIGEAVKPFFFAHNITLEDIEATHRFLVQIAEEDSNKTNQRLCDPTFLNKHFSFFKLNPCPETQKDSIHRADWYKHLAPGEVRLTCYAAFLVPGSYERTKQFSHALYQLKEGPSSNHEQLRTRYSKKEILKGVLDAPEHTASVKPLAWLSADGFKTALMQGTVFVEFPDKTVKTFGTHKHNGFAFNKKHVGKKEQDQYWFFKPLTNVTSRKRLNQRIAEYHESIVAGDIGNLGFGSFVLLSHNNLKTKEPVLRPTVLADTGGALKNNVSQFDLFMGLFQSKQEFWQMKKYIPESTQAYFLIKKRAPEAKGSSLKNVRRKTQPAPKGYGGQAV